MIEFLLVPQYGAGVIGRTPFHGFVTQLIKDVWTPRITGSHHFPKQSKTGQVVHANVMVVDHRVEIVLCASASSVPMPPPCPPRAPTSAVMLVFVPGPAAAVLSRTDGPGRGCRPPGDGRPGPVDDRQPGLRRALHPGAALGRRRRRTRGGPRQRRARSIVYWVLWLGKHSETILLVGPPGSRSRPAVLGPASSASASASCCRPGSSS